MEAEKNTVGINLQSRPSLPPVVQLVALILFRAVEDRVEQIELRLENESSTFGLVVDFWSKGRKNPQPCAPGVLFSPIAVVLCNHAAIPYYAKGHVAGTITTHHPDSVWRLESDDLKKGMRLSRVYEEPSA